MYFTDVVKEELFDSYEYDQYSNENTASIESLLECIESEDQVPCDGEADGTGNRRSTRKKPGKSCRYGGYTLTRKRKEHLAKARSKRRCHQKKKEDPVNAKLNAKSKKRIDQIDIFTSD